MALNSEPRSGWHISPQVIFGVAIVLYGVLLTAENLGIAVNVTQAIRFWPMVFTVAGLTMVLDRYATGSRKLFGAVLVIGGLWQTAISAFKLNWFIDEWWPLILIAFGVFLIARAVERRPSADVVAGTVSSTLGSSALPDDPRHDTVNAFALMAGVKRNIASAGFRRASLTAIMGGVEMDLRQCQAAGGESVVDVFAFWGGIQLRIPPDWQVVSEVTPIMGGVDDRSGHTQPSRHRLVITGVAIMGGVEVKS